MEVKVSSANAEIQGEATKTTFPFQQPIAKEAIRFYNNAGLLFPTDVGPEHPAPNKYLNFVSLCHLAQAIRRQITVDDLKILLRDEGIHQCFFTEKNLRAISWAIITKAQNEKVRDMVSGGKTPEEALRSLKMVGPFWIVDGRFIFVSGTPIDDDDKTSPLLCVYRDKGGEWGMTLSAVQRKLAKQRELETQISSKLRKFRLIG